MILLALDSCLLFFISFFTGIVAEKCLNKFFKVEIHTNFFETFLLGLAATCFYFTVASFFLPVNYFLLIPLLLPGIIILRQNKNRQLFFSRINQTIHIFLLKKNLPFTIGSAVLLFIYWIIPPQIWDSGSYHYVTIRWYEQYKIIPGLANVHGRFAFNPANFIISAAYSFTDLFRQSLYPLNGVVTLLFYTWLYKKILQNTGALYSFILFIAGFLLFRVVLVAISSPSADLLATILQFYCGFRMYELLKDRRNMFADYLPLITLCFFSVLAKLTAIPTLLLLPFIFLIIIKPTGKKIIIIKCVIVGLIIFLPWLARNFLLSGYFLFPVPGTNILHPDWQVPESVVQLEYLFAKFGPRAEQTYANYIALEKMDFIQLAQSWFHYCARIFPLGIKIFLTAAVSPIAWLFVYRVKGKIDRNLFFLWLLYYLCVCIWLYNSPEFRFGLSYMLLAILIPVLELFSDAFSAKTKILHIAFSILTFALPLYYATNVIRNREINHLSIQHCWLKPARDNRYSYNNDSTSFQFVDLGHDVKLYMPDKTHACLNANGPCMIYPYGQIELRGDKITDGFRNVKDNVQKNFPYLKESN